MTGSDRKWLHVWRNDQTITSDHISTKKHIVGVSLSLIYNMLYIILKHFLSWFQKCKICRTLLNPWIFMTIYVLRGQNDNFRQKNENLITWRIISQKIKTYNNAIGFVQKFYPKWHLAVNINFFQKFYKWRHNDRKWSKSSNSCTNLDNGRLFSLLSQK